MFINCFMFCRTGLCVPISTPIQAKLYLNWAIIPVSDRPKQYPWQSWENFQFPVRFSSWRINIFPVCSCPGRVHWRAFCDNSVIWFNIKLGLSMWILLSSLLQPESHSTKISSWCWPLVQSLARVYLLTCKILYLPQLIILRIRT